MVKRTKRKGEQRGLAKSIKKKKRLKRLSALKKNLLAKRTKRKGEQREKENKEKRRMKRFG